MAADDLVPSVAKSWVAGILLMWNDDVFVSHGKESKRSAAFQCRWILIDIKIQIHIDVARENRHIKGVCVHIIFKFRRPIPFNVDGLVQEGTNSIANVLKLCVSCTNPSIYSWRQMFWDYHIRPVVIVGGDFKINNASMKLIVKRFFKISYFITDATRETKSSLWEIHIDDLVQDARPQ